MLTILLVVLTATGVTSAAYLPRYNDNPTLLPVTGTRATYLSNTLTTSATTEPLSPTIQGSPVARNNPTTEKTEGPIFTITSSPTKPSNRIKLVHSHAARQEAPDISAEISAILASDTGGGALTPLQTAVIDALLEWEWDYDALEKRNGGPAMDDHGR